MARSAGEDGPHLVDIHVGRRLCEARLRRGLTQTDLARALGLTFQQIQKYEKGANRVSASKLWDAAQYLKVEINEFFVGLPDESALSTGTEPGPQAPPTRSSLEIGRLSKQLTTSQQRIALDFVTMMSKPRDS